MGFMHQQLIEILSYAMVITVCHLSVFVNHMIIVLDCN
jgi:hypothetical protein